MGCVGAGAGCPVAGFALNVGVGDEETLPLPNEVDLICCTRANPATIAAAAAAAPSAGPTYGMSASAANAPCAASYVLITVLEIAAAFPISNAVLLCDDIMLLSWSRK